MGGLLLDWSQSFENFEERAEALQFFGWSNNTASIPCSWTGITCFDDGTLTIYLVNTSMKGAMPQELSVDVP